MKLVFFGQTSNGKSTMINAILGQKILPSRVGRTIPCFITVDWCDEHRVYFMNNNTKEYDLNKLVTVANEIKRSGAVINSHIELFCPTEICKLLKHNVQLLDSPGVDVSKKNDKWIETYCIDSDVFVYVVNGPGTINESERKFFRKVNAFIKDPNIFVVMNKWDLCDTDENKETIDEDKKQHYETVKEFLCDDLKIQCDSREKTFFLSAMEQLKGSDTETNDQRKQQRKEDFDRFYQTVCREMAERAIINKFLPHIRKGTEYLERIMSILSQLERCKKDQEYTEPRDEGRLRREINKYIEDAFARILEFGRSEIKDQSLQFAWSVMNDRGNEAASCLKTAKFVQAEIIKSLSDILEGNVKELGIQIKGAFTEYSQFHITDDALRDFFQTSFPEHIGNLKIRLSSSLQEGDSTLQDRYASKERQINKFGFRSASDWLAHLVNLASLALMRQFPIGAPVTCGIAIITSLAIKNIPSEDKSKEIMEYVKNETTPLLMEYMTDCYTQCQKDIEEYIHKLIDKFVADHSEARTIMDEIDVNLKNEHHNISRDLLEEEAKMLRLGN